MTRRGFTLLELLVVIVLVGVIALLVYGTAQVGVDTEARLVASRHRWQSQHAMRTLIEDALRNARPALRAGDPAFVLQTHTSSAGIPQDQLTFVTRGGFPPLTGDADWSVTIEPTPAGLAAVAVPLGVRAPARVAGSLAGITGVEIRVQAPSGGPWLRQWAMPTACPRAVTLTFWSDSGPSKAPLRIALPLGGAGGT